MSRLAILLALVLAPTVARAQQPAAECTDSVLASIRIDGAGAGEPGGAAGRAATLDVDTSYTFSVDQKRWSQRDLSASVAAGLTGTERASWRACFGAWVTMRRATVEVENARGTVHLRANLTPLMERLRRHPAGRQQEPAGSER